MRNRDSVSTDAEASKNQADCQSSSRHKESFVEIVEVVQENRNESDLENDNVDCLINSYVERCVESFESAQPIDNVSPFQGNNEDDNASSNFCVLRKKQGQGQCFKR